MLGRVTEFDAVRGIGTVADGGGARYRFHAANIADGTRHIDAGADIEFDRLARFGTWEATAIKRRS